MLSSGMSTEKYDTGCWNPAVDSSSNQLIDRILSLIEVAYSDEWSQIFPGIWCRPIYRKLDSLTQRPTTIHNPESRDVIAFATFLYKYSYFVMRREARQVLSAAIAVA